MNKLKLYSPLSFGLLFTLGSLLSKITIIVPILSIIPLKWIYPIADYLAVLTSFSSDEITSVILAVLLIFTITLSIYLLINKANSNLDINRFSTISLIVVFFIIHPLVFIIYHNLEMDGRTDGQSIFLLSNSFLISSLYFTVHGGILNLSIFKKRKIYINEIIENKNIS